MAFYLHPASAPPPSRSTLSNKPPEQGQTEMNRESPLRVLLQNFVFCTVIALILWQFVPSVGQYGFFSNFVHAQAIGGSITLLSIGLSRWAKAAGLGNLWVSVLSLVLATGLGIVIGLWIAGTVLGLNTTPLDFLPGADHLLVTAITAIIASLAFNWHLNRRENVMRLELTASEEKRRADSAHHAMLRAQLDPHMLFNTLANLRALIGHDTDRALDMLDRMDSFLRATLKSTRASNHRLAQELKVLDDYLALMKIRMDERLTYSFTVADNCKEIHVPALILQPLVENAIRHGIDPMLQGGHINIEAQRDTDSLILIVEDSGIGMHKTVSNLAPETVTGNTRPQCRPQCRPQWSPTEQKPAEETKAGTSIGFGLENLQQRLLQSYGSQTSMKITSAADWDSGTRITLQIPVKSDA